MAGEGVDIVVTRSLQKVKSTVLEARVDTRVVMANGPPSEIFIKIYRSRPGAPLWEAQHRLETEFSALTTLWEASEADPELPVVRPLACLADHLMIVTKKSAGQTLQGLLKKEARVFPGARTAETTARLCWACGRWLRCFQHLTSQHAPGTFDVAALAHDIERLLTLLSQAPTVPVSAELRKQITTYCHASTIAVPAAVLAVTGVHGDFFAGNILAQGDKVTVLDFEMFRYGSRWQDVTYFLHQLRTLLVKPWYRSAVIGACERAFLAGYGSDMQNPGAAKLFDLFMIQHALDRLVYLAEACDFPRVHRWYARRMTRRYLRFLADTTRCVAA